MCIKSVLPCLIILAAMSFHTLEVSAAGKKDFPRNFYAGLVSSPKGVGFCMDLWHNGETFTSLSFTSDLIEILNGVASTPGGKATFHYNFIFETLQEGRFEIYAGPGLTAGYVRNTTDNRYGIMSGISGDAGVRMACRHNLVLSFEYQADFALIFKNKRSPNMALYRAGFKHSYYPHLRIQYSF